MHKLCFDISILCLRTVISFDQTHLHSRLFHCQFFDNNIVHSRPTILRPNERNFVLKRLHQNATRMKRKTIEWSAAVELRMATQLTYLIRRPLTEYVADVWTRHNFQCTATHPGLEWQFQIFSTPNIKVWIVVAQSFKEFAIDCKQSSSHCRRVNRFGRTLYRNAN